jgi:hypothetical protein
MNLTQFAQNGRQIAPSQAWVQLGTTTIFSLSAVKRGRGPG